MKKYLTEEQARVAIVEIGRRMYDKNMVVANDGNISVKIGENRFVATPAGVSKGFMQVEDLVVVDSLGNVLDGGKPSSELKMHLRVYAENQEVTAVTHAHPPFATAFAVAGKAIDSAILTEAVVTLGIIPVARYATPSTKEVGDSIAPFCKEYNGVLLSNHGALTWGRDLTEAYFRLEQMEYVARVSVISQSLPEESRKLSQNQISQLLTIRQSLGISSGGVPKGEAEASNLEDVFY